MDEPDHAVAAVIFVRRVWSSLEAYHALVYFAPEVRERLATAGMKGFWMGYFAGRAAPLGAVGPAVVTALFHGFHPDMVARALPDAWAHAGPDQVLAARLEGVDRAARQATPDVVCDPGAREAARLSLAAAEAADDAGRALFAAHRALPVPDQPHLALWHAATLLREHRGDGHVAALTVAGIDGCEAHVLQCATGAAARPVLQPNRGWSDADWDAARARLAERGWLDDGGALTAAGRAALDEVEATTDRLAAQPLRALGRQAEELLALVQPLARAVAASGAVPYPNAMGAPPP